MPRQHVERADLAGFVGGGDGSLLRAVAKLVMAGQAESLAWFAVWNVSSGAGSAADRERQHGFTQFREATQKTFETESS